jgi:cell division septation protein DedD
MASRDSQTVILSRQAILLVTAVGVGLLTLCYVLGVQVGKQSAALRSPQSRGAGEDLQELPTSVAEQLKAFQKDGSGAEQLKAFEATAAGAEQAPPSDAPKPERPAADLPATEPAKAVPPKPAAAPDKKPAGSDRKAPEPAKADGAKAAAETRWSLQLISTPDAAEAQRMAGKARDAGFPTVTVKDNGLIKVRLSQTGTRTAVDAVSVKLKNRGFKPFAIRAQ